MRWALTKTGVGACPFLIYALSDIAEAIGLIASLFIKAKNPPVTPVDKRLQEPVFVETASALFKRRTDKPSIQC